MTKSIFLLADGTGNAAASPFKTNVWRLYQAIDQTGANQIAFYNDGVGTETFKPLRALGGAFGIGLARDVKDLYQFLCRNYNAAARDRIFLFGFSRGAFTARILEGLILRCGIVKAPNDSLLTEYVEHAYSEYKRDAARRATATRWNIFGLWLRFLDWIQRRWLGRQIPVAGRHLQFPNIGIQIYPDIDFIGVWDTVDAYGMPIDGLKIAIDKWFCPMTLADRNLPDDVQCACHALSLDDERPTFRPVLWTEPALWPERLTQVWFAGVHVNVGGGYPDDGLAYVALQWIMREAQLVGARFLPDHVTGVDTRVDAHGHQYDSRAGLAGYYRYRPRNVDDLCNDPKHGVSVPMPLVHRAAYERITVRQAACAPTSFPTTYCLADYLPGALALQVIAPTEMGIPNRDSDMDLARNVIWRRRVAYFATVFSSAILALLPIFDWIRGCSFWQGAGASISWLLSILSRSWEPVRTADQWLATLRSALRWAVEQQFLPRWTVHWLTSFANHPTLFLLSAALLLWLFLQESQRLQTEIFRRAENAWRHSPP
ncbi:DUF2235 domain-containing protein [Bradyrhizobium sp. CCGUVB23]|uniref:DUF2235 domain-containing protein n=1 Tax=Bradyrhizobium sp. CCGUVB23 TaxID=2949630 RepID=UPI0020B2909B|nr:DUF2235 domain-containing protein [Bradyrhizobium sp. CCGUVB23]MCP3468275.1 DUF2235 domain-containing protein [Bradyrhizobium sp. CCGUVB23]